MYDHAKFLTLTALVVKDLHRQPTIKALAAALLNTVRHHEIPLEDYVIKYLAHVAGEKPTYTTPFSQKSEYKRMFACLNPLLWTAKQINSEVTRAEFKDKEPNAAWVGNYRTKMRANYKDRPYLPSLTTNVSQPVDPITGHHYCDTPEFDHTKMIPEFYLFHAQRWALSLFAERMTAMYGDNHACPYCRFYAPQFRIAARAPVHLLAYEWLKHRPRIDGAHMLISAGKDNGTDTDWRTRKQIKDLIEAEAARYGHTGHLDIMSQRLFTLPSPPAQTTLSEPSIDEIADSIDIGPMELVQPIKR